MPVEGGVVATGRGPGVLFMNRGIERDFLGNRGLVALQSHTRELSGLFRKAPVVPPGTAILALFPDGGVQLFREGKEFSGDFPLVLVKTGEITLTLSLPDLKGADGSTVAATVVLKVRVLAHRADLFHDFVRSGFTRPGACSASDLKAFLTPAIRQLLVSFAGRAPASELVGRDTLASLREHLGPTLERSLFGSGLRFEGVAEVSFSAPSRDSKPPEPRPPVRVEVAPAPKPVKRLEEVEVAVAEERGDRVYAALGSKVLEIDPCRPREGVREHVFPEALRSVRIRTAGGSSRLMVAGSKHCVFVAGGGAATSIRTYRLPEGKSPRGGVNSVDVAGGYLYGSHSEYGVLRWKLDSPGEAAERLYPELTEPHRTTRAVQVRQDRLIFATGPNVYSIPLAGGPSLDRHRPGEESPVTGVAVTDTHLFAGTEGGSLVCWKRGETGEPRVLLRRKDPVLALRVACLSAIPHVVYGARDHAVRARVIGEDRETAYESGGATVGLVDASSDWICATDGPGRRIFFWQVSAPTHPVAEIEVWNHSEKPVLDLWMSRTRAEEAAPV